MMTATELEMLLVMVILDRAVFLHERPDVDRLRRDLAKLPVLHGEPACRLRAGLERLADAGDVATLGSLEAVARDAGLPPALLRRVEDDIVDEAIINVRALEEELRDVRRRQDLDLLGRTLVRLAAEGQGADLEEVATAAQSCVEVVRRVHLPVPRTSSEKSGQASHAHTRSRSIEVEVG